MTWEPPDRPRQRLWETRKPAPLPRLICHRQSSLTQRGRRLSSDIRNWPGVQFLASFDKIVAPHSRIWPRARSPLVRRSASRPPPGTRSKAKPLQARAGLPLLLLP